ncbi:MAG: hypothetical protein A2527_09240 [Candidatus Lambdaproteobacteria bacterium RIFOXYD2_FULL_50_16]|uniref:Sugar kinase n=1 Tax=Candidatus Lambdaproteobacteria bacterium RIFOXYD2_FULL_50_16 TaxID=1817772 RepID=A0A1F6G7E6_9PROT|nr:MAG: hypothetical protein A2527_09240 [Candidatus Lambdaproteobacteria bacterium RIFOXYD2_FULL_50_16]
MKHRIGIDLGGTKTEVILTRANPLEVVDKVRVPTGQEKGYHFILGQIAGLVQDFWARLDDDPVVGIGIPGTINPKTGLVRNANTQCLIGQPFGQDLAEAIGLPVRVENDANCFALAEARFGAGKGYKNVMGIILGTGMGGGLINEGHLWVGAQGIAGEFGHSTINFEGPKCWCGNRGCLEVYISGTAAEANYQKRSGQFKKLAEIYPLTGEDPHAQATIQDYIHHFGLGMANLISCYDPDIVILGGGASNLPLLYTEGIEAVRHHIFNDELDTPIVQNQLGDSSGVFGAALLADS